MPHHPPAKSHSHTPPAPPRPDPTRPPISSTTALPTYLPTGRYAPHRTAPHRTAPPCHPASPHPKLPTALPSARPRRPVITYSMRARDQMPASGNVLAGYAPGWQQKCCHGVGTRARGLARGDTAWGVGGVFLRGML
ncbi:hypothetical protein PMIN01_03720 [Paraphaeosphaeria minitans]|uniref:Uncharacterized protein n=1 Tax=Paraphaeosphaeria minitans TaxID=565426 RepID=A0A9P6GMI8_9PLEO|nr:hypothetical protein PMIN01_03720 [Paraphaeosphaeria minitans]